jgi:hypothetical protein
MSTKYFIDIETDGLDPKEIKCVCLYSDRGFEYTFKDSLDFAAWLRGYVYDIDVFIGHNTLRYDYPALKKLWCIDLCAFPSIDTQRCLLTLIPVLKKS